MISRLVVMATTTSSSTSTSSTTIPPSPPSFAVDGPLTNYQVAVLSSLLLGLFLMAVLVGRHLRTGTLGHDD